MLKICVNEISLLQHRNIPNIVEGNTYVDSATTIDDKFNPLCEFQNYELVSIVTSPSDNSYSVENIIIHKVAKCQSQFYKDKEAESYDSSDENKVVDLVCREEISYEDDESSYLSQGEDTHLHPILMQIRKKRAMMKVNTLMQVKVSVFFLKLKNRISSLECMNHFFVEKLEEELSTQY